MLRSVLARRGAEVVEALSADAAAQAAEENPPHLIVVDADASGIAADADSAMQLADAAARNDVPIVVLGTFRRSASPLPTEEFIAKPYHYGALVRRIEELLGNRP